MMRLWDKAQVSVKHPLTLTNKANFILVETLYHISGPLNIVLELSLYWWKLLLLLLAFPSNLTKILLIYKGLRDDDGASRQGYVRDDPTYLNHFVSSQNIQRLRGCARVLALLVETFALGSHVSLSYLWLVILGVSNQNCEIAWLKTHVDTGDHVCKYNFSFLYFPNTFEV